MIFRIVSFGVEVLLAANHSHNNYVVSLQILGPLVFRVDSKFSLESSSERKIDPQMEDTIYSLNYSLRLLGSGKVVAWYSPKRKEGMVELRLFEF